MTTLATFLSGVFVVALLKLSYNLGRDEERRKNNLHSTTKEPPVVTFTSTAPSWATLAPAKRKRGRPRKTPVENSQK